MARRQVTKYEILKIIQKWHSGKGYREIHRSLEIDRRTARKYASLGREMGVARASEFPKESDLIGRINEFQKSQAYRETPVQDLIFPHIDRIKQLITQEKMDLKEVLPYLRTQIHKDISYSTLNRFVRKHIDFRGGAVRVQLDRNCLVVPPSVADLGAKSGKRTKLAHWLWMHKLSQGKMKYRELESEFLWKVPPEYIKHLHECILVKSLRVRNRAMTVLSYFKGIPQKIISDYLLISRASVRYHLKKYKSESLTNLLTPRREGPKKYDDPIYKDEIFSILHSPPSYFGFNRSTWRQSDMKKIMEKKGLKISKHCIAKIIKNAGYRYRKAKTVLTSNDPEYKEKVRIITEILSNLTEKEKFFSVDEYGPFAIKKQGGKSLVPSGQIKTIPQHQKSKGSLIITAALELSTNQITHFFSKNKNTDEMLKLLKLLIKKYEGEDCIYFSWDAASWHVSKKFLQTVEEINRKDSKEYPNSPILKLAPLPTCAQFLNVIESVFSGMARAIINNSDYGSINECMVAIDRYFAERNCFFEENPRRAGNKIWGKERVKSVFNESNNCKDPMYR